MPPPNKGNFLGDDDRFIKINKALAISWDRKRGGGGPTWRIIPELVRWLITVVSFRPFSVVCCSPCKWPKPFVNRGFTSYLLTGMILQIPLLVSFFPERTRKMWDVMYKDFCFKTIKTILICSILISLSIFLQYKSPKHNKLNQHFVLLWSWFE